MYYTHTPMSMTLKILQLNIGKRTEVQQSLMNDKELQDFAVLAIAEPHARIIDGKMVTSPMGHKNWNKLVPTRKREGRWPIRSMMWIRSDIETSQVPIESADLTAAILTLPERRILVISVYIPGQDPEALTRETQLMKETIRDTKARYGTRVDTVLLGDFNQHDELWGGDNISAQRQGEADPIIDLMIAHSLQSLLPRGTITWENNENRSTIDLMLVSAELAQEAVICRVYGTEHGSDHRAIESTFDTTAPERTCAPRYLFRNAPWKRIRERVQAELGNVPSERTVQDLTDRLTEVVEEAVTSLTPKAKPSSYEKRWWTKDLTQLRQAYTHWRNRARSQRRWGWKIPELEGRAKEAAKEFHDAIRKQKKAHWEDFVAESKNIWQVAKYVKPQDTAAFDKIPSLSRQDGSKTETNTEQAEELLKVFFPPLPIVTEKEPDSPRGKELESPEITAEEVERAIFKASSWKAPGADGMPAMVWKQMWPAVKDWIVHIFKASMQEGMLPHQWRSAKIIPFKKPGKPDYTIAKAYRPISLLSTLGKAMEALVAERISYMIEEEGLLPTNHFGARKQRSTEHALTILQEHIYKAWRSRKVLSLVSFDLKGAYNGVHKERLLQRLAARRIPQDWIRWVNAFCSDRTAEIVVNGQTSKREKLQQAGLPQGSPLSPVLFLFYNADLVQQKITTKGGAVAFVDDYTAWVTGTSAALNRESIQKMVDRAVEWERRSGATFEPDKTAYIHFTRSPDRSENEPIQVKNDTVLPRKEVKLLGVIMDAELRYRKHIAKTATKGLAAAMALKRLRMTSPSTARQLFAATVAPVMDYASNIWKHARTSTATASLNRAQRVGAQAITGVFRTVATAVAEAEACIRTIEERHQQRAAIWFGNLRTLPRSHPLAGIKTQTFRRFTSPLQKIAQEMAGANTVRGEEIHAYAVPPWKARMTVKIEKGLDIETRGLAIAMSASKRNGLLGAGAAILDYDEPQQRPPFTMSTTVAKEENQNLFTTELRGIATALSCARLWYGKLITIYTCSQTVLQAINKPGQQSGQESLRAIYDSIGALEERNNKITGKWIAAKSEQNLLQAAKTAAKEATKQGQQVINNGQRQARAVIVGKLLAQQELNEARAIPERIGMFSKEVDKALPGRHTRAIYDALTHTEAVIIAQLRTGMARLNGYLHRIGAAESDQCECGAAKETVKHFLFRCIRWEAIRKKWEPKDRSKRGNLSWAVGGKELSDSERWKPNIEAVRRTIGFALATKRLQTSPEETANATQQE